MSELTEKLVTVLSENALDKKPTVADLAKMAGVEKVTGEELNAAWMVYQDAQAGPSQQDTKAKADTPIDAVFVKAVPGAAGFRRAGFRFTQEGYGIALEALTDEQLAAIEQEPNLIVKRGTFEAEKVQVKAGS